MTTAQNHDLLARLDLVEAALDQMRGCDMTEDLPASPRTLEQRLDLLELALDQMRGADLTDA